MLSRAPDARRTFRRATVRGSKNDGYLLPSDLPRSDAQARECALLPISGCRAGSRVPAVFALPSGDLASPRIMAGDVEHRLTSFDSDRGGSARLRWHRGLGRTPGNRRASAAAALPSASGGLADRGRADAPRAAGQATHSRNAPLDG